MGPDEIPSREELGLMLKLIHARLNKSARAMVELVDLLKSKGVLTDAEVEDLATRLSRSPEEALLNERIDKVCQFAEVHKAARKYLDQLEE